MRQQNDTIQRLVSLQDEIAALLPFYITGRLGLRDQMRVEQWLDVNPHGQKALENAYGDQRAMIDANEHISSPSGALGKLLKDIDQEPSQVWSNYVGGNALSWAMSWLNWIPSAITWGAVTALLLVTLVQSTLLMTATSDNPTATQRTDLQPTPEPTDKTISVFMRFVPHTKISDITTLLASIGAVIIDGPQPNNVYVVRLHEDENRPSIRERLDRLGKRSDLVQLIGKKN